MLPHDFSLSAVAYWSSVHYGGPGESRTRVQNPLNHVELRQLLMSITHYVYFNTVA